MKTLLIAEKPDVAKQNYLPLLERVSGEKMVPKAGYFESPSYYLTWFVGHLLENLMPEEYNEKYKSWDIANLPIIPSKMVYKIKGDRQKQAHTILELCQTSDRIICGTDADREGQRIFSSFIDYYKLQGKQQLRLWPSPSYADDDLDKSWKKMKGMLEWQGWTNAAEMRNETDWLLGMNASRAYSSIARTKLPVGRVQTATLSLIVERDHQVENYSASFYHIIRGQWGGGVVFTYYEGKEFKFDDQAYCERKLAEIRPQMFSLEKYEKANKKENPPRPFSQPELQIAADKKYGFSAMKTLEISQQLYDKKYTTYPRSDSNSLPTSDFAKYRSLVDRYAGEQEKQHLVSPGTMPGCFVNKEEPHSALTVTMHEPRGLTPDQEKIYNLIRDRLVLSFMYPAEFIQWDMGIKDSKGNLLKARIRKETAPGYKAFFKDDGGGENNENEPAFQDVEINEDILKATREPLSVPRIDKIKRSKPQYFTQGSLLTAMKNCGRKLESEEDRRIMAQKEHPGIGTPATQAQTIQQILHHGYADMQKNKIVSTTKGRKLIDVISPDLKTPALTAAWEGKLSKIQDLEMPVETYRRELHEYVRSIIESCRTRMAGMDFKAGERMAEPCPNCKGELYRKNWGIKCATESCSFSIPVKIAEKTVPETAIKALLAGQPTATIKGFKSKSSEGKTFDARLKIGEQGKVTFSFDFSLGLTCPMCRKDSIEEFVKGMRCKEQDCQFVLWSEVSGKKLKKSVMERIIKTGKSGVVKGFTSAKNGRKFDAELVLQPDGRTKFQF